MKTIAKRVGEVVAGAAMLLLLAGGAAQAAATMSDTLDHIERILGDVERAKDVLTGGTASGDYARAQEALRRKEAELERARVDAMSAASGQSRNRIIAMRASGMSWAGISRELGVSASVIGIGADGKDVKGKGYEKTAGTGKKKGWKDGMPPGQAKKMGYGD